MDTIGSQSPKPSRRHLLSPEVLARAVADSHGGVELTRGHGQSNGVRVHGTYFAMVSLAGLVLIVIAIALTANMV